MELLITSTQFVTKIDGVPVRLWKGALADGGECDVFVHRIGSADPRVQAQLEEALQEQAAPADMAQIVADGTLGALRAEVERLRAENAKLRGDLLWAAERIAAQSEALSSRAERGSA